MARKRKYRPAEPDMAEGVWTFGVDTHRTKEATLGAVHDFVFNELNDLTPIYSPRGVAYGVRFTVELVRL